MKKAVFFDIDGTLIDAAHGMPHMSEASRQAIRSLQAAGHYTFIASGRPYAFLDPELLAFGFDGYVLMNGAAVMMGDQVIYKQTLPMDFIDEVCSACDARGVEYLFEGLYHVYTKNARGRLARFYEALSIPTTCLVTDFAASHIDVFKMEFNAVDSQGAAVYDQFQSDQIRGMRYPLFQGEWGFELYARSETKGSGILHALSYLGIPVENSFAFGDGDNDFEMMTTVGTSLVMGNAQPALKEAGDYIVPTVTDDGVAAGITQYIL